MQHFRKFTLLAALCASTFGAQAALVARGGGMIYDTTLNITWLADMNYAATSGYAAANAGGTGSNAIEANGRMGWGAATAWANNLVYGGFDDWRLANVSSDDTSCSYSENPGGGIPTQHYGYDCTGGELSHLFVVDLGNKARQSVLNQTGDTAEQRANFALFSNVQGTVYWSGLEYEPESGYAWTFQAQGGSQDPYDSRSTWNVLAVRSGDVAASVPEPQTLALVGLALVGTASFRKRRAVAS